MNSDKTNTPKLSENNTNGSGFYIISLCHTAKREKFITLWRPNNSGYCFSKENAGIYLNPEDGYHNSDINIPISECLANELFISTKYEGKQKMMILNNKKNHRILKVKSYKDNLILI